MSEKNIEKIQRDLEELKSILITLNQSKLEEEKQKLLPKGSIKEQIYNLCDGDKSITDMAQQMEKTNNYISSYLNILRKQGLIRKIEKNGEIYYEQIF